MTESGMHCPVVWHHGHLYDLLCGAGHKALKMEHGIYDSMFSGRCPLFLNPEGIHRLVILVCFYTWPWLCWPVKFSQRSIFLSFGPCGKWSENTVPITPPIPVHTGDFPHLKAVISPSLWIWASPVSCFDQQCKWCYVTSEPEPWEALKTAN